jgi:hypothetical protein
MKRTRRISRIWRMNQEDQPDLENVNLDENLGGDVEDTDVDQDEGTLLILTN